MKPQYLTYIAGATALADAVLAYGDKIQAIPGIPGGLAHAWPFVLILATAIHQFASAMHQQQTPTPKP